MVLLRGMLTAVVLSLSQLAMSLSRLLWMPGWTTFSFHCCTKVTITSSIFDVEELTVQVGALPLSQTFRAYLRMVIFASVAKSAFAEC